MKNKFTVLALLMFVITSMSFAQPYYVSTSGSDVTGTGTAGNPWATINYAIATVSAGNTIIVAAGTYSETVIIDKALILQGAKAGLDARSRSGAETIISSSNASGSIQIGPVAGTVTIDGFTVSGSPVKALHVTGATTTVIVQNNIFESATTDGINLFRAQNATVEYNWVKGAGTSGITAGDDAGTPSTLDDIITTATIRYNKIQNSRFGITGYQTGSVISYNEVIGNATLGSGIGGQFYSSTISNNTIHDYSNGAGIAFNNPLSANRADSHDVTTTQNKVYGNSAGIYVNQALAGQNILVNHNNISGNTTYGAAMDVGASGTLDATNNWWGSASGPSGVGPGSGDAVVANVTYDPWFGKNVSPGLYAGGVSVVPNFVFTTAVTGTLQVSSSTNFSSIVLSKSLTAASSYTFSNVDLTGALSGMYQLSNNTTYYWRIYDTGTSTVVDPNTPPPPFENYYTFTTVTSAVPIILPLTIVGNSVYITWYPNPYASGLKYDLMYSLNSNMSAATTVSSLTTTFYTLTGLTPGTNYYVQIRSKNSAETVIISYSAVNGFTTAGLPTPLLTYPTGGATVYSTTPTAYWYITAYYAGLQYQVRYATNSSVDGSGMLNDGSAVNLALTSDLYVTFPALTAGTTYYWQVRSYDGVSTYSSWSSVASFVVYSSTPAIAPVPNPSWPVGGATSYINPPTVYWYLGTYATGLYFYVEWSSDGFTTVSGNSGWFADNLYYALPTALASGTYSWHVKSRIGTSGSESAFSSTATFVIPVSASSAAAVPIVIYPTGGTTVYVLNPTLNWYAYSSSALEFEVRISTTSSVDSDGMLSNPLAVSSASWTAGTSMDVGSIPYTLTAGAPYYWQVRSRLVSSPGVVSSWSSVGSFATAAGSFAIVPLTGTPNFGQPINSTNAVLNWNLPVKSNSYLNYDVEFSKNSDFSNSTIIRDIPEKVTSLSRLDMNSTYYWRVLSKNSTGSVSNYSQTASFNTGNVTEVAGDPIVPSEFSLSQNYPNPFNPTTRIKFTLPQNSFVTIKIYDMLGREIKTLINQEMTAGSYSIDWNAENNLGSNVSSGMYIYRITAGSFVATKKMVLIK